MQPGLTAMMRAPQIDPVLGTSAVSGLVWGLVAMFLGFSAFGHAIWAGVVVSPFIGMLIGRLSAPLHDRPRWMQIAGSLFFLYVAATAFAVATGVASLLMGSRLPLAAASLNVRSQDPSGGPGRYAAMAAAKARSASIPAGVSRHSRSTSMVP